MNTLPLQNHITPKRSALTLCVGEETGANITCSLAAAASLARDAKNGPVLYINTIQTSRQLGTTIRSEIDPEFSAKKIHPGLTFFTAPPGLLSSNKDSVEQYLDKLKPKTIIINSLDFASKDYRRKEELIFTVMEWLDRYDLNIIIFSELRKSIPKPGKIQRGGGVGKFAAIAEEVRVVGESEVRSPVFGVREEEKEISGTDFQSVREEISVEGLTINSTGIVNEDEPAKPLENAKHYPMSNKNRALVAEYEKLHGKAQQVGESFRDMFDRILGIVLTEKAIYSPDKLAIRSERKEGVREMLSV